MPLSLEKLLAQYAHDIDLHGEATRIDVSKENFRVLLDYATRKYQEEQGRDQPQPINNHNGDTGESANPDVQGPEGTNMAADDHQRPLPEEPRTTRRRSGQRA